MPLVLDASALIALIKREPGWDAVASMMKSAGPRACFTHTLNLIELYYIIRRKDGAETALNVLKDVESLGLKIRRDAGRAFVVQTGDIKALNAGVPSVTMWLRQLHRRN